MIDSSPARDALQIEGNPDAHVIELARTILQQHDEAVALVRGAVQKFVEDNLATKLPYTWETQLEEEEARLIADAEAKTREKLQNVMDWFRWHFERWETAGGEEGE